MSLSSLVQFIYHFAAKMDGVDNVSLVLADNGDIYFRMTVIAFLWPRKTLTMTRWDIQDFAAIAINVDNVFVTDGDIQDFAANVGDDDCFSVTHRYA